MFENLIKSEKITKIQKPNYWFGSIFLFLGGGGGYRSQNPASLACLVRLHYCQNMAMLPWTHGRSCSGINKTLLLVMKTQTPSLSIESCNSSTFQLWTLNAPRSSNVWMTVSVCACDWLLSPFIRNEFISKGNKNGAFWMNSLLFPP